MQDAFVERDLEIEVSAEGAVVGKRVSGVEEVIIHMAVATVRAQVSDTVRKEQVHIEGVGRTGLPIAVSAEPGMGRRPGKKRHRH